MRGSCEQPCSQLFVLALILLLRQVAAKIPRVNWVDSAAAMQALHDAMPRGAANIPEVVKFTQGPMYQILRIMVGLVDISELSGVPKTFSRLQASWGTEFDEWARCFEETITNSMR